VIKGKNIHINQGEFLLSNINFNIDKGEYVVFMGKTGCGKTTVLETICGLRKLTSGEIWLNDKEVSKYVPAKREIGYVPQDGALFSTMSVKKNIGFALKIRKWNKQKIEERVEELANLMNISHLLNRNIQGLSGGEKQRVALARALSFYPYVLCLDEPLSALDESTKQDMIDLLNKLKQSLDITVVHVTHSNSEAIKLADRILYLEKGIIQEHTKIST
jgi:ABC-type sugar transport system ATPase subunit